LVRGEIRQEAIINLVALRTLTADISLKRYLLGLALVALSYRDQQCFNLREGCLLRAASKNDYEGQWKSVNFDGTETVFDGKEGRPAALSHADTLEYAKGARNGVTFEALEVDEFDKDTAEAWLKIDKKKRKTLAKTKHPKQAVADESVAASKKNVKPVPTPEN
jgi:hypothetical protein